MTHIAEHVAANLGDVANTALDNILSSTLEGFGNGVQQAVEGTLTDGEVGNLIAEAGGEPLPPAQPIQVFL